MKLFTALALAFTLMLSSVSLATPALAQSTSTQIETDGPALQIKGEGFEVIDRSGVGHCAHGDDLIAQIITSAKTRGGGTKEAEEAQLELAAFVAVDIPGPVRQLDLGGVIVDPSADGTKASFLFVEKDKTICYAVEITQAKFQEALHKFRDASKVN